MFIKLRKDTSRRSNPCFLTTRILFFLFYMLLTTRVLSKAEYSVNVESADLSSVYFQIQKSLSSRDPEEKVFLLVAFVHLGINTQNNFLVKNETPDMSYGSPDEIQFQHWTFPSKIVSIYRLNPKETKSDLKSLQDLFTAHSKDGSNKPFDGLDFDKFKEAFESYEFNEELYYAGSFDGPRQGERTGNVIPLSGDALINNDTFDANKMSSVCEYNFNLDLTENEGGSKSELMEVSFKLSEASKVGKSGFVRGWENVEKYKNLIKKDLDYKGDNPTPKYPKNLVPVNGKAKTSEGKPVDSSKGKSGTGSAESDEDSSKDEKGMKVWQIALIVGGLVIVIGLGLGWWLVAKNREAKNAKAQARTNSGKLNKY